jgi:hypothetical protein
MDRASLAAFEILAAKSRENLYHEDAVVTACHFSRSKAPSFARHL